MHRKLSILLLVLSLFILTACTDMVGTEDVALTALQTKDGGFILAGYSVSKQEGRPTEALLIKTDALGKAEWSQTYAGKGIASASDVLQTEDGGYILVGSTRSSAADKSNALLVKVDVHGVEEWHQTFGGSEADYAYSVLQTQGGGYILAGGTQSYGPGNTSAWIIKTDAQGAEEWSQAFGNSERNYVHTIYQAADGSYILAGDTDSTETGRSAGWLVKTDAQGHELWSQTFGGSDSDYLRSMQKTQDGGYILAGSSWSFGTDYSAGWLVKTDAMGNEQWTRTYGGADADNFESVLQTKDGGFILAGSTRTYGSNAPYYTGWLVKTDDQGEVEWSQTFDEPEINHVTAVLAAGDGGHILVGKSETSAVTHLLKTDAQGIAEWSQAYTGSADHTGWLMFVVAFLVLPLVNGLYFLALSKDMAKRKAKKPAWLVRFLLLGPLAVTWYKSYRTPKDGETAKGSKPYQLVKNFFLPWSIYVLSLPILYWVIILFFDSLDAAGVMEGMFWLVVLYGMFIVPFWLGSMAILGIIFFIISASNK